MLNQTKLAILLSLVSSSAFADGLTLHPGTPVHAAAPDPVVGGTLAKAGEWPDAVAVLADDAACTGTLIAPDVVLTAGHCIGVNPKVVIVNTTDYMAGGGEVIDVKSATAYPNWQNEYDVGVLVLAQKSTYAPRAVVSDCTASEFTDGTPVHLVGFGLTTKAGTGDNSKLHEATLDVTDAACETDGCQPAVAPGGEFMAGGGGTDACFGDSGGPIYLETAKGPALIGVVSRGLSTSSTPCGSGGVYIRADKVVSWIEKTTGRTIARASCTLGKADGQDFAPPDDSGGCSAGGSGAGGAVLALGGLGAMLAIARKRR
jgi:endonuclease G